MFFLAQPLPAAEVLGHTVTAAFGPDGRLWRAVPRRAYVEVDVSSDLGRTFSKPVRVNQQRQRIRAEPEGRPQIQLDADGGIYVAYNADGHRPNAAFFSYSGDDGQSFSEPVSLQAESAAPPHLRLLMRRAADGKVTLVWLDPATGAPGSGDQHGILYGGPVLTGPEPAMMARKILDGVCECCRMDMEPLPDGGFALISRMVFPGMIRDIGALRIAVDGTLVAAPVRLTHDEWKINACPEHGPALSIGANDRYHIAWFTEGTRRQGSFYAHADGGGMEVSIPVQLGDASRLAGHADVLALAAQVAVVWQEYDGERHAIRLIQSADNGQTWSAPRELASARGPADYPMLLGFDGQIYLSWYAAEDGYRLVPIRPGGAA